MNSLVARFCRQDHTYLLTRRGRRCSFRLDLYCIAPVDLIEGWVHRMWQLTKESGGM
jgi:hypothetical protein